FIPGLSPLFDFEQVLRRLHSSHLLAVATNRGRSMERLAAHFGLDRWFVFFISTLDAEPKPHPEMLYKCIAHFGVSEGDAVYFGDADSDSEAAARAGIDFIRVGAPRGIASVADILLPDMPPGSLF
ncbi:MAG: HAD family hydrolase, partial [Chrysiogenales bacterium]